MFQLRIGIVMPVSVLVVIAIVTSPTQAEPASTPGKFTIKRDIVYSSPDGKDLLLDAYVPNGLGPFPAVLVVHGGSWKSGNKTQLSGYAMRLAARGFAAFAINYRLAPDSKHPAQINDCRAALRWIEEHADEYHVDADRIGAIGYSAGAHLVFLLGMAGDQNKPDDVVPPWKPGQKTGRRLKAVVAGGSPCDFTVLEEDDKVLSHFLGGTKGEVPEVYVTASPAFYLSEDDPPILFFHGTADELVTIRGPEIMIERLQKKGVEASLYKVPGGDHITAATNLQAVQTSIEFLEKQLKPMKSPAATP
ncbi:alpha/beta hydrolase [bacterium]|nr:alpha/beta hydrolase [bacterium]